MKRSLTLISLLLIALALKAQNLVFQDLIDLNSDGKVEQIKLSLAENSSNGFILSIADKEYAGSFGEDPIDGFRIIDINSYDRYKEIAVHAPGSSDLDENLIFWYDGKNIIKMDKWGSMPKLLGNGIFYIDTWEGFWLRRDKWVLNDKTRTLHSVPQYAYYVGIKIKVLHSFSIFRNKDLKNTVALLSKDSEIELLLYDNSNNSMNENLYLIKSSSGLVGWAKFEEIQKNSTGFPWAG